MENLEEEILDSDYFVAGKVYTKSHIVWAAVFAGPFAIAYMFNANFKKVGKLNLAFRSWLVAILFFYGILTLVFNVEIFSEIPSFAYAGLYAGLGSWLFTKYLGEDVSKHIRKTGLTYSGGRVFVVIVIGFFINIIALAIFLLLNDYEGTILLLQGLGLKV